MRLVQVHYDDLSFGNRKDRYYSAPMEPAKAREVADALALMGCTNFTFEPAKAKKDSP